MKCEIHGAVMEYMGENPFGGDIWYCEACHDEEEAAFEQSTENGWDEELDDDGVYEGDVVIHEPYDDED